ncbi:MAG: hypothetical protein ACLS4Z_01755 [Christensenellaceae bacterium]
MKFRYVDEFRARRRNGWASRRCLCRDGRKLARLKKTLKIPCEAAKKSTDDSEGEACSWK